MKDRTAQLTASRKQLLQQMPDLSTVLPGSLLSRMVRCNKPGCRFCEKGKGKGHGPIWILSVSLGNRQVRQIPVPLELKQEVEEQEFPHNFSTLPADQQFHLLARGWHL